ncbi:MAG: UDP-N-acetylmuramoyl-L-alanine--D-glutamate ligase [Blastocatellia bacterium]|nr:UDP-N-acetylmuramoyl-L-alanine--D-glutamate ligase [Blastocatellia bacterium]
MELAGKKTLVVGLGKSGIAAAGFLRARGAHVIANDAQPEEKIAAAAQLKEQGIELVAGSHPISLFENVDLIVASPGVPLALECFQRAKTAGVPIISEIELAARFLRGRLVGITGSNGKTTTTTLIGKVLKNAGLPAQVGGNIGTPLISLVETSSDDGFTVIELSSFQLEAVESLHLFAAVLLNITPDHLDRYDSMDAYAAAKANIFRNQTSEDLAVLNADDTRVAAMTTNAHKTFFSCKRELEEGLFLRGDEVVARANGVERTLISRPEIGIRGAHNLENVMATLAVGLACGAGPDSMRHTIHEFKGVEHRLEFVVEINGVKFYNDSKATNVDSTIKALEAFDSGVIVILGGKDKGGDYAPLVPLIQSRCEHVILIGAAANKIATALENTKPLQRATTMPDAVRLGYELARAGDVVLLAPACASFDMFDNYEHRGRVFKDAVRQLRIEH